MFDFTVIGKVKQAWNDFKAENPDVVEMIGKVEAKGFCEGMTVDLKITYPDGTVFTSDLQADKKDVELLQSLSKIKL